MEIEQVIQRLKDFSLFADFKDDHQKMAAVAGVMESRKFSEGQYIMRQGDKGEEMFILTSGSVRVCKNTKADEEYTITDLNSDWNVFFGELALMDNDVRSASIKVLTDCNTLVMNRNEFNKLSQSHPDVCLDITRVIVKIICGRLRTMNDDVIMLFDALVNEIETTQL